MAGRDDVQRTATVNFQLVDGPEGLRQGMTGYGRISTRGPPVGVLLLDRALRWLCTQSWWW
jgi:hypothetical protein